MERESFKSWLDSYGRAWMGHDPNAAAALYTEDATYQVTPFSEPLRGRDAIYAYWEGVAKTEKRIQFGYEVIAVTAENGVARWWASFVIEPPGLETKLDGIFVVSLNSDGRCLHLREWWHKLQYP
jgi:uncharacterized protein (TIGR02246 family)